MKLLKLSLLAILMAFVMMSCKDDTTSPTDENEEFTIITEYQPLNVIIKTFEDDVLIDSIRVYIKENIIFPKNFYLISTYQPNVNILKFNYFTNTDNNFRLNVSFENDAFKKGNYNLITNNESENFYENSIFDNKLIVESGSLFIKDIKHFRDSDFLYYISGNYNLEFYKLDGQIKKTSVIVEFENLEIEVANF